MKAQAYYELTNIPTIAGDSGLYITKISNDKQPGLFIRRVNNVELSDDDFLNIDFVFEKKCVEFIKNNIENINQDN